MLPSSSLSPSKVKAKRKAKEQAADQVLGWVSGFVFLTQSHTLTLRNFISFKNVLLTERNYLQKITYCIISFM
jgi:hypothetical protein